MRETSVKKKENRQKRLAHLIKNFDNYGLSGYPWPSASLADKNNKLRAIFNDMVEKSLYSRTTNWFDARIGPFIEEAQKAIIGA